MTDHRTFPMQIGKGEHSIAPQGEAGGQKQDNEGVNKNTRPSLMVRQGRQRGLSALWQEDVLGATQAGPVLPHGAAAHGREGQPTTQQSVGLGSPEGSRSPWCRDGGITPEEDSAELRRPLGKGCAPCDGNTEQGSAEMQRSAKQQRTADGAGGTAVRCGAKRGGTRTTQNYVTQDSAEETRGADQG